ncbi:MAG: AI-2E family transporter [Geobacteraceae bacterium GWC2_48_7]|nr:MAG: AI-2E family transporter [Geobacteraceae bacterium GWC2_48_7]
MDRKLFTTLLAFSFALLLVYLLFLITSPFLAMLVWATAIGSITFPLYKKMLLGCDGKKNLASFLMTASVVLALILPLIGLIFTLSREAAQAYQYLEILSPDASGMPLSDIMRHPAITVWLDKIKPLTAPFGLQLETIVLPAIRQGISYLLNYSTEIVKNFFAFLIKLVLLVIALFFVYKDGSSFLEKLWLATGVDEKLKNSICETVSRVLGAVMYGIILTCIVQGALGGLGFWVAGLPSPFLFGTLMAICAPIPIIGTALFWLPGAIYLLIQGKTVAGLLLMVWGALAVSSIDNVIRPLFISGKANLHLLVIVIGVLGGIVAFGITGVVIGPIILALLLVFLEVYQKGITSNNQH